MRDSWLTSPQTSTCPAGVCAASPTVTTIGRSSSLNSG